MTLQMMKKDTNKFFKQQSWYKDTPPHTIDDIHDELMEGKVKETIETIKDQINDPIVNAGRVNNDDIKKYKEEFRPKYNNNHHHYHKTINKKIKPRDNNYQQGRDKWYKNACKSCEFIDRELFKFCKENHKDSCFLSGADFINGKEIREKVNQYNVKYKGGKAAIKKDRTTSC